MNLYLHFPFCQQKCFYCDFVSLSNQEHLIGEYCEALVKEIELYTKKMGALSIETIYLGGGTPSIVDVENLSKVFAAIKNNFTLAPNAEITIEANPDSVTKEKLQTYINIGINRLSMGVQAWQNDLLKLIGRTYEIEVLEQAYQWAREAGFTNINLDLIFALPTQTKTQWQESLTKVIALQPEHIACYSLEWDNNSIFANKLRQGRMQTASDQLDRQMYHLACQDLKKAGYEQYEISNFAKPGFACQHNADFWTSKDYLGLGVAAVSKVGNQVWENQKSLKLYCKKLSEGKLAIEKTDVLSKEDELASFISLALRTNKGIDKKNLKEERIKGLINNKLVKENDGFISLTDKGKDILNQITLDLLG